MVSPCSIVDPVDAIILAACIPETCRGNVGIVDAEFGEELVGRQVAMFGGYLVVFVVLFVLAPELLASAVIAGIVAVLVIVFTGDFALYAREIRVSSVSSRTEEDESHIAVD